jgi:hypothetical protein
MIFDLDASMLDQDFQEDFPVSPSSLFLQVSSSSSFSSFSFFFFPTLVEPSFFGSYMGDSSPN